MDHIPGTAGATEGGVFGPRQAAALLDQATAHARRTLTPLMPLLWVLRAPVWLVVLGGFWLSVRGQHPYTGHISGWAITVALVLAAVNIGLTAAVIRRAGAGVSGPAQRKWHAWFGVMLAVWILAYAVTAPLYHSSVGHPVWGLYPASAPLLIIGLAGTAITAAFRFWVMACTGLASAIVAAAAGFGGPAGSWLIMAIGLCTVCLGTAAFTAWQQNRSLIRS
jgi:hypothetical protein